MAPAVATVCTSAGGALTVNCAETGTADGWAGAAFVAFCLGADTTTLVPDTPVAAVVRSELFRPPTDVARCHRFGLIRGDSGSLSALAAPAVSGPESSGVLPSGVLVCAPPELETTTPPPRSTVDVDGESFSSPAAGVGADGGFVEPDAVSPGSGAGADDGSGALLSLPAPASVEPGEESGVSPKAVP